MSVKTITIRLGEVQKVVRSKKLTASGLKAPTLWRHAALSFPCIAPALLGSRSPRNQTLTCLSHYNIKPSPVHVIPPSHSMSTLPSLIHPPSKALIFDLMGTCTDWKSSIVPALRSAPTLPTLPEEKLPQLAADWRVGFFTEIHSRFQAKQEAEGIDVTHRRVLDQLLEERGVGLQQWDDGVRKGLVDSWHVQKGWCFSRTVLVNYD